jgi:DNA polymerase I
MIRNKECKDCELHKTAQKVCIIGQGPVPCDIMIVGEAPRFRREEYSVDIPFSGKAGRVLDIILKECNLSREEIYITNLMHCGLPENRTPSMDEMRACRKYLLEEVKVVKPKLIFAMGSIAIKGLFDSNLMSLAKERGKILDFEGTKVVPTYHPAATLYQKYYANLLYSDMKMGIERLKDKSLINLEEDKVDYQGLSVRSFPGKLDYLREAEVISCDVETTGLDYMDKKESLVSINLSVKPQQSFILNHEDVNFLKCIFEKKKVIINHNIKFDLEWLHRYGINVKCRIFDTMVAKHLLDENYPDKELKHLARVELGMFELSEYEKIMIKHRKEGTKPSWEEYIRYGGGDSDAAIRLYYRYKKELKDENLYELFKTEMRVLKTLTRMEIFGFKIDLAMHKKLVKEYKTQINVSETKLRRLVGEINFNSSQQLGELLFKKLKLPIIRKTDAGAPSCDEATLKELVLKANADQKEFLELLLSFRRLNKLYNTYLEGLTKNGLLKDDERIHCNFKICGTKTGRLSCSEPNLENIPRDGAIKKMFISSFKNGKLIQVDYSQMELRILAHYANDKALIRAFKEGRDIHTETTAMCLHKPYSKVTEEERKVIGKRVNFGIVYLIGPQGLSERIGCTKEKAQSYIQNWFGEFKAVKRWMNERTEEIIATGRSVSFNGRVRRLYGASSDTPEGREAIRQGVNSPIQGGAGDITKYNMYRLDKRLRDEGYSSKVINNVHDAVIVDCKKEEVIDVQRLIKEIFVEPPVPLKVGLEFEIKIGDNWQDMEEVQNGGN